MDEKQESEGFHNQFLTIDAAARLRRAGEPPVRKRKSVVLQLDEREQFALDCLGGLVGLRQLLAPEQLCLRCRAEAPLADSPFAGLCAHCWHLETT